MKNLVLACALLLTLGCVSGKDDDGSGTSDRETTPNVVGSELLDAAAAPDAQNMLAVQVKGTALHRLPALLEPSGVRLEISPTLSDRALDVDSVGEPLSRVLGQVARSVGGRVTYTAGTYRILPVMAASESPLPQSDARAGLALLGALPREDIKRVINTHSAAIRLCYERALNGGRPNLQGKVDLHFIIGAAGRVLTADIDKRSSTLVDAEVESCILDVSRAMVFPEPTGGGIVEVHYPFVFKAAR